MATLKRTAFHRLDCQQYRQWKKQQASLSKESKKKMKPFKRKDRVQDCLEDEKLMQQENENDGTSGTQKTIVTNVNYRKCKKKSKKISKRIVGTSLKRVSPASLLLSRIQPLLTIREQFITRHVDCLLEGTSGTKRSDVVDIAQTSPVARRRSRRTRKTRKRDKSAKKEDEDVDKAATSERNDETKGTTATDDEKESPERKVKRKKDKFWCKKIERKRSKIKRKEGRDTKEIKCESVCSFDSDVCLKGVVLTADDKKKIADNRKLTRSETKNTNEHKKNID